MKLASLVALAAALAAGSAFADRPTTLAGSTWTLQTNRDSAQLVITTQAGAPAGQACRIINGTLGVATIRGLYCADTGHIRFQHRNASSGVTVRTFSGSVSDDVVGQPLYMAGTMTVYDAAFGEIGDYNFSAVR